MKHTLQRNMAVAFLLLVGSGVAHATTYEVAPNGNDANAGTAVAPFKTLQKAANTVAVGDTVLVGDGTYAGFRLRTSGTAAARILFKSKNKWGAKVTSAGPIGDVDWIAVLSASYVTIDGFEVLGATRAGINVRTLEDESGADTRNNIVQNCYCHDNGLPSGGAHDGIFTGFALNFTAQYNLCDHNGEHGIYISNSADNPIVRGNICSNNRACGIQLNADFNTQIDGNADGLISNWLIENNTIFGNGTAGGSAINLDGDINGVCRNNLIYNNLSSAIALYGIDGAQASHDNLIVNNTIYQPNSSRSGLLLADDANNNIAFNNIIYVAAGKSAIEINAVTGFQHDYNFVSSIEGGALSAHESSQSVSTLFVNAAGNDYHLKAGAPAVNAGVSTFAGKSASSNDLEARARPQGAGFDLGAYEQAVAANLPVNQNLSPANLTEGCGVRRSFAATYFDPDGANDISMALFRVGSQGGTSRNSLLCYCDVATNKFYVRDDADTAWQGGVTPGVATSISNSYGTLDCAQTSVSKAGNNLTVTWSVIVKGSLAGTTQGLSLFVRDKANHTDGYDTFGAWNITGNVAPQNVSLTPSNATNAPGVARTFVSKNTDPNGNRNMAVVFLKIGGDASSAHSLLGYYQVATNKLYLRNDAGTAWLGGVAPGSATVLSNSQGSLDVQHTSVSVAGNDITVSWAVKASGTFIGAQPVSLYVRDNGDLFAGYTRLGTWQIVAAGAAPSGGGS